MNQMELIQNAVLSVNKSDVKSQKGCSYPTEICKTNQIKDKQFKGIQTAIAPGCKAEDVAVLVDTTMFSSAKEGFVFALDGLYASKGYLSDGPFEPPAIPLPLRYETLLGSEVVPDNPAFLTLRWKNGSSKVVHASIYAKFLALALSAVINALEAAPAPAQAQPTTDSSDEADAPQEPPASADTAPEEPEEDVLNTAQREKLMDAARNAQAAHDDAGMAAALEVLLSQGDDQYTRNTNLMINLAIALARLGQYEKAEHWAAKAQGGGHEKAPALLNTILREKAWLPYGLDAIRSYKSGMKAAQEKHYEQAAPLLEQAAQAGLPDAVFYTAQVYLNLDNLEKAEHWAHKASALGHEKASVILDRVQQRKEEQAEQTTDHAASNALLYIALTLFNQGNLDRAAEWAEKAKAVGLEGADNLLIEINSDQFFYAGNAAYENGDQAKAIELWKKAAELGNSTALYNIALTLKDELAEWATNARAMRQKKADNLRRKILSQHFFYAGHAANDADDLQQAIELWKQAVENGSREALINIALTLAQKGNLDEAAEWAEKAAQAGVEDANELTAIIQRDIALRDAPPEVKAFHDGMIAYKENKYDDALALWQQAAELGYGPAMDNIGVLFNNGDGVKWDRNEALRWYIKAYETGHADGAYHAAHWYKQRADDDLLKTFGPSGEQRNWLVKAAELGHQKATEELKSFKKNGMITNVHQCLEDYKAGRYLACAEAWLAMAEEDDVHAKRCLALLYHQGLGVAQNKEEADRWFLAAAKDANSPYHTHQERQWPQLLVETAKALNKCIDPPERKAFATVLCLQAAELGSPEGARYAAEGLADNQGGPVDLKLAMHWAKRALHLGAPGADHAMTVVREKLGLEEYEKGRSLCNSGDYKEAAQLLWKAAEAGNAAAKFKLKCLLDSGELHGFGLRSKVTHQTDTIQPMDTIELGRFKQTKDGQYLPIRWLVLAREKRRALVISRDALEVMPYHENSLFYLIVRWHDCGLRQWLNGDFINEAFTVDERKYLWPVVTEKEHPNVKDLVFLLSPEETKQYFGKYVSLDSNMYPDFTAYARRDRGALFSSFTSFSPSHCWLRASAATPRDVIGLGHAPVVGIEKNSVSGKHVDHKNGVRPAMWITL